MIVEWECILNCNHRCTYCSNGHNGVLKTPIMYQKDKQKVFSFIGFLKNTYPNDELFLFGGEPFLHPFIGEIVQELNNVGMNFVIQTNFSLPQHIPENCVIQVSAHPTEIKDIDVFVKNIQKYQHQIRRIDVMYIGEKSIDVYKKILPVLRDKSILFLCPLADFNIKNGAHNQALYEFNSLKQSYLSKVYRFEPGERSFIWERMMRGEISCKNKLCQYTGKYILYDPMLNSYTCNHRQNNVICPHDHCFLM